MRAAGLTFDAITAQLGYKTRSACIQDIQRAMAVAVSEPAADLRALEAARLEMLWVKAMQVLSRTHVSVSNGRVVYVTTGDGQEKPVTDDAPVLAAIRELRMISESRRKLFGLDAPQRVEVFTDDAIDAEIRRLTEELNAASAGQARGVEAPTG
jgi:hypothetical protein